MSFNGIFDFTDFTDFDNNSLGHDYSSAMDHLFDTSNWGNDTGLHLSIHQHAGFSKDKNERYLNQSIVGGSSQPYTGVEVLRNPNGFLDLDDPTRAPTTLYPANRVSLNEGHNSLFHLGMAMPTLSPQAATIPPFPTPTLSRGSTPIPPNSYAAPTTFAYDTYTTPQAISNPDGLGFDILAAAGPSSMPVAHSSLPFAPSREESWGQTSEPGPSNLPWFPSYPITGATTPMIPLPTPVASSSGPQRTGKCAKGSRKYNPVKTTKRKGDSDEVEHEDGWDVTLVRFRAKLHDIVRDGQPSGGLSPETALAARITKSIKEDLKRSPFQDTRAGDGKRPRNVEDYLACLLREVVPAEPTLILGQGGSYVDNTKVAVLARVVDALEAKLVAVNQLPALRSPSNNPHTGKGSRLEQTEDRVKKNLREKSKRGGERLHLERISRLFKAVGPGQTWTRVDVLSFAIAFLLFGSSPFSPGFIKPSPVT